jgi:hypothetical protein
MKYLKSFKKFDENAAASASSTSGMGAVSAAQPGALAGTTGTTGSGDIGFTFKKEKRKKGDPTKVTDMRDLAPAKGITKIKESNSESRDPKQNSEVYKTINDCLLELFDEEFTLLTCQYDLRKQEYDVSDDEVSTFTMEELEIKINKKITKPWTGNIGVKITFDENGIVTYDVQTLRPVARLHDDEQALLEKIDDACHTLINQLGYTSGKLWVSWQRSMLVSDLVGEDSKISIDTKIILSNVIK